MASIFRSAVTPSSCFPPESRARTMLAAAASRLLARATGRAAPNATAPRAFASASTPPPPVDVDAELDAVHALFASAREDLEDAADDQGEGGGDGCLVIVMFPAALTAFEALCARLPPDEAARVRRASGLKMEQLKAELSALEPH